MAKWLLIDANYLCHRAHHSVGPLSHNGTPTGVTFGVLSSLLNYQERFEAPNAVFCFDLGESIRKRDYPQYKANRGKNPLPEDPDEAAEELLRRCNFRWEVHNLREVILPRIGYQVLAEPHFEADDMIAVAARWIDRNTCDDAVIISADHDLLQLLSPQVTMYSPARNKVHTIQSFRREYDIPAKDWWLVKAMAGCSSDNVAGIRGVGEKTALKYIKKQIKPGSARARKIEVEFDGVCRRNSPLVKLPHTKTPKCEPIPSAPNRSEWEQLCKELGFQSLKNQGPYTGRRRHGQRQRI